MKIFADSNNLNGSCSGCDDHIPYKNTVLHRKDEVKNVCLRTSYGNVKLVTWVEYNNLLKFLISS